VGRRQRAGLWWPGREVDTHLGAMIINGDLLIAINVLSFKQIFQCLLHVDEQFLILLRVFICGAIASAPPTTSGEDERTVAGAASRIMVTIQVEGALSVGFDVLCAS